MRVHLKYTCITTHTQHSQLLLALHPKYIVTLLNKTIMRTFVSLQLTFNNKSQSFQKSNYTSTTTTITKQRQGNIAIQLSPLLFSYFILPETASGIEPIHTKQFPFFFFHVTNPSLTLSHMMCLEEENAKGLTIGTIMIFSQQGIHIQDR